jgi:hypothetical protein
MKAPDGFVRALKELDKRLEVEFVPTYTGMRWVLFRVMKDDDLLKFPKLATLPKYKMRLKADYDGQRLFRLKKNKIFVGIIETQDGNYHPLTSEVITRLREGNLLKRPELQERPVKEQEERNKNFNRIQADMSKEVAHNLDWKSKPKIVNNWGASI